MQLLNKTHGRSGAVRTALLAGAVLMLGAGAAAADPLATPAMTAPLSANPQPFGVDGGALGKVYVSGAVTGMLMRQDNVAPGDRRGWADLTNAQVIVQTTSGPVQFYVQAGTYSQPFVGLPYMKSSDAVKANFGAVPIAYIKLQPTDSISILAGKLAPLIGDEYTFTFQNMNVFRGLLVAQEPADSRGVQVNYAKGPLALSVSLNDGFYSNRFNWVTASAAYTFSPADTLVLAGGGSLSKSATATFATPPAQNNSALVNVIWTHTAGPLTLSPYLQYSHVSARPEVGIERPASTFGASVLAKYNFTPQFALAGRLEYEKTHSNGCDLAAGPACAPTNLLYGPNSRAFSATLTPTFQKGIFFVRGELSYVQASGYTPGLAFGASGDAKAQTRALVETGLIF